MSVRPGTAPHKEELCLFKDQGTLLRTESNSLSLFIVRPWEPPRKDETPGDREGSKIQFPSSLLGAFCQAVFPPRQGLGPWGSMLFISVTMPATWDK